MLNDRKDYIRAASTSHDVYCNAKRNQALILLHENLKEQMSGSGVH